MRRVLREGVRHGAGQSTRVDVLDASPAIRSKMSLTNELRMAMALFEIPVSGWTCFRTAWALYVSTAARLCDKGELTLVNVRGVGLLASLLALLLFAVSRRRCFLRTARLLRSLVGRLCGRLGGSGSGRGFAAGGRCRFRGHCENKVTSRRRWWWWFERERGEGEEIEELLR